MTKKEWMDDMIDVAYGKYVDTYGNYDDPDYPMKEYLIEVKKDINQQWAGFDKRTKNAIKRI